MTTESSVGSDLRKQFEQAGFIVADPQAGRLELRKSDCVCYLENQGGRWMRSGPPCFIVRGSACELEDQGFQKFWYSKAEGRRFPIRKPDLETLHRFDEEVRYILGQKSLYNESLGTTNARTVYDRLTGRPDR
jgi:hypothetical protein